MSEQQIIIAEKQIQNLKLLWSTQEKNHLVCKKQKTITTTHTYLYINKTLIINSKLMKRKNKKKIYTTVMQTLTHT